MFPNLYMYSMHVTNVSVCRYLLCVCVCVCVGGWVILGVCVCVFALVCILPCMVLQYCIKERMLKSEMEH